MPIFYQGSVEMLLLIVFLVSSHFGLMQIFRLTTYHAYFWKSLPLLFGYSVLAGWLFYKLVLPSLFLYQIAFSAFWLLYVGYKQRKTANIYLSSSCGTPEEIKLLAIAIAKTQTCFTLSAVIYICVFFLSFVYFYNQ